MTLYEMIKAKLAKPKVEEKKEVREEEKIFNPLGLCCGMVVSIDELDLRNLSFLVTLIREVTIDDVQYQDEDIRLVDYEMAAEVVTPITCRLRLIPDTAHELGYRAIQLKLYHERGYEEQFHQTVNDVSGEFVIFENEIEIARYWRIDNLQGPVNIHHKTLRDVNGDGKVSTEELKKGQSQIWDFSRQTQLEGVDVEEFLFIEMDKSIGWFKLWIGTEINPERVQVFSR